MNKMRKFMIPFFVLGLMIILSSCSYVGGGDNKIKSETSFSCQHNIANLIPDYITTTKVTEINNLVFNDGVSATVDEESKYESLAVCLRKGSNEGENINYFYLDRCLFNTQNDFNYKKQITDDNGTILGYTHFKFYPVLNRVDNPFKSSSSTRVGSGSEGGVKFEIKDYIVTWSGFTEELKNMLKIDSFNINIYTDTFMNIVDDISCSKEFTEESGEFSCNFGDKKLQGYQFPKAITYNIGKDLDSLTIYQVVSYEVSDCN